MLLTWKSVEKLRFTFKLQHRHKWNFNVTPQIQMFSHMLVQIQWNFVGSPDTSISNFPWEWCILCFKGGPWYTLKPSKNMHCISAQDSPKQTQNVQSTCRSLPYFLKIWPDQTLDCKSILHGRWKQSGHNLHTGKKKKNQPKKIILVQPSTLWMIWL